MKDRKAGIVEMLIRWRRIFPGFDTGMVQNFPLYMQNRKKSKSKSNCEELDFGRKCRGKSYEKITK